MLGTLELAQEAATLDRGHGAWGEPINDRWTFLGNGCSRAAFLGPDRVVYKVLTREGARSMGEFSYDTVNELEYGNFLAHADSLPEGVRFAECYLWSRQVLAMEYIEGPNLDDDYDSVSQEKHRKTLESEFDITDVYGDNGRIVDGIMILVDYAW